jgi:hypothetical protein
MLTKKTTAVLMLVLLALVAPASAAAWSWPAGGPVLRGFDFGGPEYHEHGHSGIDVGGDAGSAVRAPAAGQVSFAGWLPRNGRTVTIRTPDGYAVTLLHLGTITVSAGDGVAETEPVGTIGPSGDVEFDVPYVHLGVRRADDPKGYVDPLMLLPPRPSPPPAGPTPPPPAAVSPAPAPADAPVTGAEVEGQADDRPPAAPAPSSAASPLAGLGRSTVPPLRRGRPQGVRSPHATPPALSGVEPSARTGAAPLAGTSRARPSAAPPHPPARERPPARGATAVTRPAVPARVAVAQTAVQPPDPQPSEPIPTRARVVSSAERPSWVLAGAALLAVLGAAVVRRGRPGDPNAARKMTAPEPSVDGAPDDSTPTDSRGPSMAVCERATPHRPLGGVRSAGGRVRPLSPSPRQSGAHGQWDGRTRDADHGRGRPGRALVP